MKNEFIPYEEALALKELGFDEGCFAVYPYETHIPILLSRMSEGDNPFCNAPLYQQAFRWFREEYTMEFNIVHSFTNAHYYMIAKEENKTSKLYDTHKEAELACLKKLIEIVKH